MHDAQNRQHDSHLVHQSHGPSSARTTALADVPGEGDHDIGRASLKSEQCHCRLRVQNLPQLVRKNAEPRSVPDDSRGTVHAHAPEHPADPVYNGDWIPSPWQLTP